METKVLTTGLRGTMTIGQKEQEPTKVRPSGSDLRCVIHRGTAGLTWTLGGSMVASLGGF